MGGFGAAIRRRVDDGGAHAALQLAGRDWAGVSARIYYRGDQPEHCLLPGRGRDSRDRARGDSSPAKLVRARSVRPDRVVSEPLHLAAHRDRANGRPQAHVPGVPAERVAAMPLLGDLPMVVPCAAHPEGHARTRLDSGGAAEHVRAAGSFQVSIGEAGTGFLRAARARRGGIDARPTAGGASAANRSRDPLDDRHRSSRRCDSVQIFRHGHGDHLAGGGASTVSRWRVHARDALSQVRLAGRAAHRGRHAPEECGADSRNSPRRLQLAPGSRVPARDDFRIRGFAVLRKRTLDPAAMERPDRSWIRRDLLPRALVSRGPDDVREPVAGVPERVDSGGVGGSRAGCDAAGTPIGLGGLVAPGAPLGAG